jgi:dTDP-4-dehydrorhamnose reductase
LRLLITGASGLYGSKLAQIATPKGHEVYSGHNKGAVSFGTPVQFDITDKNQVATAFVQSRPEVVVHAATLTDVDKCELNKELTWKVNVEGTRNIAEAAKFHGAYLMYISTDYVFSGEKGNYKETDAPDPVNYYGLTKLKAEEAVAEIASECCIARTCVIYGASPAAGKVNFALWLLTKLGNRESVKVVTDQWITPTLNTSLAEMSLELAERRLNGVFHLSGASRVNRYEYALLLAEIFGLDSKSIVPVSVAQMQWAAKRPRDSSLDTSKAQLTLKNKPLQIQDALQRMKKEIAESHRLRPLDSSDT